MRQEIEEDRLLPEESVFLLFDVCSAVGLTEGETQSILGPTFFILEEILGELEDSNE
jgi:hypothetical protein